MRKFTKTSLVMPLAVISVVALMAAAAGATPGSGIANSTVSLGRFAEMHVKSHSDTGKLNLKTKGETDLWVVSNTFAPGGHSGWHTHPGPSLITVKAGAITVYDADDPTCTPKVYTQGMGFVDHGGDHAHLLRNEGTVDAITTAVQFLPAGADRRIDAPAPTGCAF